MLQQIKPYCLIDKEKSFLNKKRKSSDDSLINFEDEIYEINENIINESYIRNKELIDKVIEVNLENDEFFAVVEKRMKNGKIKIEKINTKYLKNVNPWALIKYYEDNNII